MDCTARRRRPHDRHAVRRGGRKAALLLVLGATGGASAGAGDAVEGRAPAVVPDLRARVRMLPVAQLRRLLAYRTTQAESRIDEERRVEVRAGDVVVVTDAGETRLAQRLLEQALATRRTLEELCGPAPAPHAWPPVLRAYAYADADSYRELVRRWVGYEWAGGIYDPVGVVALSLEQPVEDYVLSTFVHEVTHAWLDRYVLPPGTALPLWLNEGLAEYLANSDTSGGEIVPGAHRHGLTDFVMLHPGVVRLASASRVDTYTAKRALRRGVAPSLDELFAARAEDFYGPRRHLFYAQSWMLVHYLRHGVPERDGSTLARLLRATAAGVPAATAIERLYDLSPEELESELERYVREF